MSAYHVRVVDAELDEIAEAPAIALEGAKGVGKTTTAARRAASTFDLDESRQRELLSADPDLLVDSERPVLIDEWQRWPEVWDRVRRHVDRTPGARFLLTGSVVPTGTPIHSGAGRILGVRMRPLSLAERDLAEPTVRLADLFAREPAPVSGHTEVGPPEYAEEIVASGFPGIRPGSSRIRQGQLDGYVDRIIEREFPEAGAVVRRPAALRAWLTAYAAATGTTTSYDKILRATLAGLDHAPSKVTAISYRDALARLWMLDPVPAWVPSRSPLTRLGRAPKHFVADPGLAARLLGVDLRSLRTDDYEDPLGLRGPLFGRLFEALVALSLLTYTQANEARLYHLRTTDGRHEVDFIVERADGSIVALEVKLGSSVDDADLRHLHWLRERVRPLLRDCAVITTGSDAYRRRDGVGVIPAALLGP